VQPPDIDIAGSHVVMRRHHEVRQGRLIARCHQRIFRRQLTHLAHDPVRSQRGQQVELAATRRFGAPVGQIDDLALGLAGNRRMRRVDKAGEGFGGNPEPAGRSPFISCCTTAQWPSSVTIKPWR
jgi:hypothetical protein